MRYVEGSNLESYLKKNKSEFPENIDLSFFSQIVSDILYAYSIKIIYRDLKSDFINQK
jgi:serine/threonine protein kinase